MRILKPVALAITLCIASTSASAIPLNFSFYGTIDSAVTGNAFGLDVGDTVTVSGMFDSAVLTGSGFEVISFGAGTETPRPFHASQTVRPKASVGFWRRTLKGEFSIWPRPYAPSHRTVVPIRTSTG